MSIDHLAAGIFAVALLHTFLAKQLERLSTRYPRHAGVFPLLGEVEIVFGFWAMVLIAALALAARPPPAGHYAELMRLISRARPDVRFVLLYGPGVTLGVQRGFSEQEAQLARSQ